MLAAEIIGNHEASWFPRLFEKATWRTATKFFCRNELQPGFAEKRNGSRSDPLKRATVVVRDDRACPAAMDLGLRTGASFAIDEEYLKDESGLLSGHA